MKTIVLNSLFTALLLSPFLSLGQISIVSSGLPNANDTLVTQNANLLTTVDLELTGASYYWDFGPDILNIIPAANTVPCKDVDDTPLAYQFLFNNPFLYPNHNSDYGMGVDAFNIATITFEDAYMYYKNSGNKFSITGMGASINGIPLAAQKIDPELLFNTPLDYTDADSSHSEMEFTVPGFGFYGQVVDRKYACDGWGTMSIAGSEYDVLRLRSEVSGSDSLYSETFTFGFNLPRPATIEYTWYALEFKVPLLQIITTEGVVSSITTAPLSLPESVVENDLGFSIYPNPANELLNLTSHKFDLVIYNTQGQSITEIPAGGLSHIDTSTWPVGLYYIKQSHNGLSQTLLVSH